MIVSNTNVWYHLNKKRIEECIHKLNTDKMKGVAGGEVDFNELLFIIRGLVSENIKLEAVINTKRLHEQAAKARNK
jgi:hypothetical protein